MEQEITHYSHGKLHVVQVTIKLRKGYFPEVQRTEGK
jgi:hypothetical protein